MRRVGTTTSMTANETDAGGVCVFSPGLRLTVTIESASGGDEIHLHPGGQGFWVARSIERLGEPVVLCATVGGEVGDVLAPLLGAQTELEFVAVEQEAASPVTVDDRRSGTRQPLARTEASPIDRHAVDELYSLTLAHAIRRRCCVLAGNIDTGIIPPSYYGRLAADLATVGVPVITDLHGPELDVLLGSGAAIQLIKVSDEDLRQDRGIDAGCDQGLASAVADLAARAPQDLIVSRGGGRPAVARLDARWYAVSPPELAAVDWRGSGDAMTGALAVASVRGLSGPDMLRFGAAAGAASVTRRGLASLDADLVDALRQRVRVHETGDAAGALAR